MDKFVKFRHIGGLPSYDYYQLLSSIEKNISNRKPLNKLYFSSGFMMGYSFKKDVTSNEARILCKMYWDAKRLGFID